MVGSEALLGPVAVAGDSLAAVAGPVGRDAAGEARGRPFGHANVDV